MTESLALAGDLFSLGFVIFLGLLVLLNFLNLPGNWLALACVLIFSLLSGKALGMLFWVLSCGSAVLGEILEWGILATRAKEAGASSAGTLAGMLGAFAGALFGAPVLMGFGALPGALLGAYLGCLLMELIKGKNWQEAQKAAKGTLWGRFLGALCKCGAGLTIVLLTGRALLSSGSI
ncbi:MAG: DUF456 domain-containing protein [Desulfovibrio sp.]|nr:DUF456 domain-containing protein [Desulfovibrio sp.]